MQYNGTLHFEKFGGGGPVLLLLHGWGHNINNLKSLAEILARDRTVYAIDFPGFGNSPAPDDTWGTYEYAKCISEFIKDQDLKAVDIAGHSFGGRVCIQLAAKFPEQVKKVILINSAGTRPVRPWYKELRVRLLKWAAIILKAIDATFRTSFFKNRFVPRFASADYKMAGDLRKIFVRTVNEDLSVEARAIQKKTFLLWGARDTETTLGQGKLLHELIRGSELCVVKLGGHEIFKDVGSHLCAYLIRPFLKSES